MIVGTVGEVMHAIVIRTIGDTVTNILNPKP